MICRKLTALSLSVVVAQLLMASHAHSAKVEFTPVVAHLTPLKSQVADADASIVIRQAAGTGYGARLGVWVTPRVGVEASMLVASSSIQLIGGTAISLDATMLQLDLRARIRVNDPTADIGFDVIAGVGMSDLGDGLSDAGENVGLKSPAAFTFVIGIGGTIPVTDRIRLRFDVEDHIHDANYEIDEATFGSPVNTNNQNDIVVAAGLVIPLW